MNVTAFIGEALIGWLSADLIGGTVHWLEDRVFSPRALGLRRTILAQRRHHDSPQAFTTGTLFKRNSTTWLTAGIISGVWVLTFGFSVAWAFATLGGLFASQAHYYAHCPREAGPVVRMLQEIGLLQSVNHHAGHHRPPHGIRFCPLTNFLNPLLDRLDVWTRLERLFGVKPDKLA